MGGEVEKGKQVILNNKFLAGASLIDTSLLSSLTVLFLLSQSFLYKTRHL